MPGLGETTASLAQRRKAMMRASAAGAGDSGLVEVRGFGFNPGALRMLVYVPQGLAPGAPLVVALHACTQQAGPYVRASGWRQLVDRFGFALLAPEQGAANNPNRCFNWFEPGDMARGSGEAASIHAMVQHIVAVLGLDPARVFVTGLSAGGAMTSVLLAAYPETFAAGAVVAGLPYGVASDMHGAFAAMRGGSRMSRRALGALVVEAAPAPVRRPRLAIWHGQADATVASGNAAALAGQWAESQGLAERPDEARTRGGWTRSVWRGPGGESVIEMNLLAGLGHGTPLAAGGDDPIGEVAPFMLEAGVSSSLEIARFWGLAPPETAGRSEAWAPSHPGAEDPVIPNGGLGESVLASVRRHVSDDVQRVIEKALASAGLMR